MKPQCLLIGSVGGLRSTAATVGAFFALRRLGITVAAMAGSSGGSIALPLLSKGLTMEEVCRSISAINSRKIQDKDFLQQILDAARKKIPFLPKRKGDKGFTGVLRGNGLYFALRKMYADAHCGSFEDGKIPFVVVASKIASTRNLEVSGPASLELAQALEAEFWFHDRSIYRTVSMADAVRCSVSIPGAFRPWYINHIGTFIDGGAVDAIPVMAAVKLYGVNNVVIADATSDIFETNYESSDINDIFDVAIASAHALVRDATLQRIRQARELVGASGFSIAMTTPKVQIKMFETKKFTEAAKLAEERALAELSSQVTSFR